MNLTSPLTAALDPLPPLAPALRLLVPSEMLAERIQAAYVDRSGCDVSASHALLNLKLLVNTMTVNDLLLLVAGRPDGMQWLVDVSESSKATSSSLKESQGRAAGLSAALAKERNRFICKAMQVMNAAIQEAEHRELAAITAEKDQAALVKSLVESGLAREAVLRFVDATSSPEGSAKSHRAAAAEARQRAAAVGAYISDPHRRLDQLDAALAAELQVVDLPAVADARYADGQVQETALVKVFRAHQEASGGIAGPLAKTGKPVVQ